MIKSRCLKIGAIRNLQIGIPFSAFSEITPYIDYTPKRHKIATFRLQILAENLPRFLKRYYSLLYEKN